jgi:hypothetical protein
MRRLAVTCLVAGALVAAGCGGSSNTATFSDPGATFTFQFPSSFGRDFAAVKREVQGRPPKFSTNVGVNEANVIVVSEYGIRRAYESYKPADFQGSVDTLMRTIARAEGSQITSSGRGKLGPLDAYTYELSGPAGAKSKVLIGFKDKTEYYVDCTAHPEQAATIDKACDQVASTFKLTS